MKITTDERRVTLARLTLTLEVPADSGDWRLEHMLAKLEDPRFLRRLEAGVEAALKASKWMDIA